MTISWQTRALHARLIWIKARSTSNLESIAKYAGVQTALRHEVQSFHAADHGMDAVAITSDGSRSRRMPPGVVAVWNGPTAWLETCRVSLVCIRLARRSNHPRSWLVDMRSRGHSLLFCNLARLLLVTDPVNCTNLSGRLRLRSKRCSLRSTQNAVRFRGARRPNLHPYRVLLTSPSAPSLIACVRAKFAKAVDLPSSSTAVAADGVLLPNSWESAKPLRWLN